jgi:hypothetical protein
VIVVLNLNNCFIRMVLSKSKSSRMARETLITKRQHENVKTTVRRFCFAEGSPFLKGHVLQPHSAKQLRGAVIPVTANVHACSAAGCFVKVPCRNARRFIKKKKTGTRIKT